MGIHNRRANISRLGLFCLLACLLAACGKNEDIRLLTSQEDVTARTVQQEPDVLEESDAQEICVHVCGEVVSAGLKRLPAGSRVWDALELADGFTEQANPAFVNLAAVLEDGQQIYFPSKEETAGQKTEQDPRVDLNGADEELLQSLPGIGSAKAKAILKWREEHGRFESVEQLMEVPGIKQALYDQIKDLVKLKQEDKIQHGR